MDVNTLCETVKQRNTVLIFNDIVLYTKAFLADIVGPFVRDWRILGNMNTNIDLDIRMDYYYMNIFINILSMKYDITPPNNTEPYVYSYIINNKQQHGFKFYPIKINIYNFGKKIFKSIKPDFDVNLLCEDNNSIYVRNFPNTNCIDKLSYIKERIARRKFCIIEPINIKQIAPLIEKAIRMIDLNWTMDDTFNCDKTWVVAKWSNLFYRTETIRVNYTVDKITKLKLCDQCCICQEKFNNDDIVFNSICNHNFHWKCNGIEANGLVNWVKNQNKLSCPFCRHSNMF